MKKNSYLNDLLQYDESEDFVPYDDAMKGLSINRPAQKKVIKLKNSKGLLSNDAKIAILFDNYFVELKDGKKCFVGLGDLVMVDDKGCYTINNPTWKQIDSFLDKYFTNLRNSSDFKDLDVIEIARELLRYSNRYIAV